ncbi:MAG: response regulator transcription factor [Myxococcales bacterium]|nr:response regulator transcription factor [Myxococcales bacterium]
MTRARLVLADDHRLVLDGLGSLLSDRYEIVARVTDGSALFEAAMAHKPDVVVSDVSMPVEDGLSAARRLLEAAPQTRIVLVTMNQDRNMAAEAQQAGVLGYVLKSEASHELFLAIDAAMAGRTYTSPSLSSGPAPLPCPAQSADSPLARLTERQRQVLRLLGRGRSMKEVASELHISPRTVAFHKYRIMELLGVQTNADLIRVALSLETER